MMAAKNGVLEKGVEGKQGVPCDQDLSGNGMDLGGVDGKAESTQKCREEEAGL